MTELTHSWTKFDGDYEKKMQDIKLYDGTVLLQCWPNAGYWIVLSDEKQPHIPVMKAEYVKLNEEDD